MSSSAQGWTFDPLELKNAYFNIERLGAIVRRFVHNQYGTTSSHLHTGLPTDRCTAEWWIQSPRVEAACAGQPFERGAIVERIEIPGGIADLRRSDPAKARDIQAGVAMKFDKHFADGLVVIGFEKSEAAGTYLLGQWESN